jgi:tetratricopeptide (TPR) repeat protein
LERFALAPCSDHPKVIESRNDLAFFYEIRGRYQEAEPVLRRVVAAAEHERGYDSPELAPSLNNLAVSLSHQGRYSEAESIYRQVLALTEAAHGPDHPMSPRS